MNPVYRSAGQWCDVCTLPDGRIAFVRAEGSSVVCEIDGVEAWRVAVPAPLLMPRCAFVPTVNSVVAIGKANDVPGSALLVWPAAVNNLGATAGNNPVAITPTNAYMAIAPDRVRVISLLNAVATEQAIPWTSQGIRDVVGTTIVFGDATYAGVVGGQNFGEYQTRGALTVGQHGNGIGVLIGSQFFVPRQGTINYNVHGAQSGSRIAVCAWTEGGSYYQEFTPPYPVTVIPQPPAHIPVPVPVPVPPPPPEPIPMPSLSAAVKNIRDRYVAHFPVPQGAGPEDFDPATNGASGLFEDKSRVWIRGLAEQVRFETGDPSFGVKNAGGGRPQSKDSLTQNGARLINYDMLSGVGTGHPSLVADPQGEDITGQTFMPVQPIDHLGAQAPPAPDPVPVPVPVPTAPPLDAAPILAKLDEVIAAINQTSVNEIAKLDELKVSIIAAAKDVTKVLSALVAGGGLGGILGGVLGKKS